MLLPQAGALPAASPAIPSTTCWDHEGGLWLASIDGGLGYPHAAMAQFLRVAESAGGAGFSSRTPLGVHLAADGAVWLSGADGVDRLDPASGVVESFSERLGGATPRPEAVLLDRRGRIWLGKAGGRGVRRYDRLGAPPRDFSRATWRTAACRAAWPTARPRMAVARCGLWWPASGLVRIDAADRLQLFRAGAVGGPRDGDINQIEVDAQGCCGWRMRRA